MRARFDKLSAWFDEHTMILRHPEPEIGVILSL